MQMSSYKTKYNCQSLIDIVSLNWPKALREDHAGTDERMKLGAGTYIFIIIEEDLPYVRWRATFATGKSEFNKVLESVNRDKDFRISEIYDARLTVISQIDSPFRVVNGPNSAINEDIMLRGYSTKYL